MSISKFFLIYVSLKSVVITFLIFFLPEIFGRSYFKYDDFSSYANCEINSPNGFYSLFICAINANSISDYRVIITALLMNTVRDFLLINIVAKIKLLRFKGLVFFACILALHPYLALYHARLTTSSFAVVRVLLMYYVLVSKKQTNIFIDLSFIILTGFRNSLAGLFLPYYIWEIIRQLREIINKNANFDSYFIKNTISLMAIVYVVMLSGGYMTSFVTSLNVYSLDVPYFTQYLHTPYELLNILLAIVLVLVSHAILLLGFREAAYTEFPDFFIPLDGTAYFHIFTGIIFVIVHGVGFYYFLKSYLSQDRRYIIFIIILLPTLFSVSHLRYFLPFIPLALIGLSMLVEKKFIH